MRTGPTALVAALAALALAACEPGALDPRGPATDDAATRADGVAAPLDAATYACPVAVPVYCPDAPPRYAEVTEVMRARCGACHDGAPGGPWPLTGYADLVDWRDIIRADLERCTMPPPDAGAAMTDRERAAVLTWILCGQPR